MKKIWIYVVVIALAGFMVSCLSDDNNYDYEVVNELKGGLYNFTNLDDTYTIIEGEELTLSPTFTLTIDSINPDVSYEWYVNRVLQQGETKTTYLFKGEKNGSYEVTFSVTDNKSGIKFAKSTIINVRAVFQRGWAILSDENGRSVLHFIIPETYKYQAFYGGESFMRDSLVYHDVRRDVVPNLGTNPVELMNNIGNMDYLGEYGLDVFDELIVKQERWVELSGNTLERSIYTDQEFQNDLPADFSPVEGAMTYSAKALLDKNGLIYWENKGDIGDFHAGFYTSVGLENNTKFSRLFQAYKFNSYYTDVFLALKEEDNSFVGILDLGTNHVGTTITENSSFRSGMMYHIDATINDKDYSFKFSNIEKKVVEALPAPYDSSTDITSAYPYWVVLLKDEATSEYELRYFRLDADRYGVICDYYYENPLGLIPDYRDMAVFSNRRYAVIAAGNQLYYYQFGTDAHGDVEYKGSMMTLGSPLSSPIKAISGIDIHNNVYRQKYPYDGQLGVALEDGSFYIFSVTETRNEDGTCMAVDLKQQYPNEQTSEENKKFGKIVDVLYKLGNAMDYMDFSF